MFVPTRIYLLTHHTVSGYERVCSWRHPGFKKGRPDLLHLIKRVAIKGAWMRDFVGLPLPSLIHILPTPTAHIRRHRRPELAVEDAPVQAKAGAETEVQAQA